MWLGTWGSSQQATTCSGYAATTRQQNPSSHRSIQRCRSTVISCGRQGQHDAVEPWPPRAHQHVHTAATATLAAAPASICQEAQHRQQQFQSSSGMQSSMLRLQQQQATQLLHAAHAQGSLTVLELQQHRHKRVQHVDEHARSDVNRAAAPQLSFGRDKLCDSDDDGLVDMQQRQQQEVSRQELPVDLQSQHQQQSPHSQQQMQQQQEVPPLRQHRQRHQQQKPCHQRKALGQQGVQQQQPLRQPQLQLLSHPAQLTGWIKHCSSLEELQQLYNLHGDKFNPINLSAMLVRLARLYGNTGCDSGGRQHSSSSTNSDTSQHAAQQLALQLAEQLQQQLSDCDSARQAANGMWALASLQCNVPDNLLQQAAQQLVANDGQLLRGSQPQELATLAWGFGKLQHDPCCALWPHILAAAQHQQHFDRYKPQELAMLLWAYANRQQQQQDNSQSGSAVGQRQAQQQQQLGADHLSMHQRLQERRSSNGAASTSASKFGDFEPSSRGRHCGGSGVSRLAENTVSNRSSSNRRQVPTVQQGLQALLPCLSATIQRQLQQRTQPYKSRELSMLLWSLAVFNHREQPLLQALAHNLQQQIRQGRANAQDISTSLWGAGKLQFVHCGLLTAAAEAHNSWPCHCSLQDLALALYGSAACSRAAAAAVPWQHVSRLWQHGVSEVQARIARDHTLGPAEVATLLQSCQLLLQQGGAECRTTQHQQQHRWHCGSPSSVDSVSSESSISSMSSVNADERDAAEDAARAARSLLLVLHDHMLHHPSLVTELGCKHLPCVLHSLAGIEQADCRPAPEVVSVLMAAAQSVAAGMNRQQLCMTAWAAARLAPGKRAASPQVAALMDTLQQAAVGKLSSMQPQQLSILAWSHARLWNLGDNFLLHEVAKAAVKQLPRFGPQALSNLAWAFARERHYDAAFTAALARRGKALLHEFSAAELANLMWGLVTLGYQQGALFRAVAAYATEHCKSWDAKACIKLVDAFSRSGVPVWRFRALFYAVGDALAARPAALSRTTVHELVQLAVAYATFRVRHKAFLGHVASAALHRLDNMAVADVIKLSWALAVLNQPHQTLLDAISARIAAEMAKRSDLTQDTGASASASGSSCTGSVSDTSAAPGTTSRSNSTNRWLMGGKLRVQHLPRLAWAFRTLKHDDAAWYMAAARHAEGMQQHLEQIQPGMQSGSTTAEADVPMQHWDENDSVLGATLSVQQLQSRNSNALSRQFTSKVATDVHVCNGPCGSIHMGPSTPQPVLLQRPDYRPNSSEASVGTAFLLRNRQQPRVCKCSSEPVV